MACTCGCDSTCGCDCCGKPGGGAGRPEVAELRAKVARLEAELAWTAMATGVRACRRRMPKVAGDAELPGRCRVPGR
jgi:hypothetical protein